MYCCSLQAHAQKLKFQQLGTEDGLPANEVYNLHQDKKGYIWAFTEYGIVKHNGTRFVPVCKNIPFEESAVYAVSESPDKELCFANSKAHIYTTRNDSAFLVKGIEAVSRECMNTNQTLYDLLVDNSGNLYFSSFTKSYKLEKKANRVIPISDKYKEDSVSVVYKKINGRYFFIKTPYPYSRQNYIKVLDENDKLIAKQLYSNVGFYERTYIREQKGCFYFLSRYGIILRDPQGRTKQQAFTDPTISMEIAPNGHVWIGTGRGLYEMDAELNQLNFYFSDHAISDILFDRQGGMWVSTIQKGIYYCKDIYTNYYDNTPELSLNISMLKKIGNRLFIGTGNGQLFIKEDQSLRKIRLPGNTFHITDIILFDGKYVVGSKNNISLLDKNLQINHEERLFAHADGLTVINSYGFQQLSADTLAWIGSTSIVKKSRSSAAGNAFTYASTVKTRSIISRAPGQLLIGSMHGLYVFDRELHIPGYLKILKEQRIATLKADHEKNIWICTKGSGLYILKPDNSLIKVKNAPADVVNNISFLTERTVLLSTNKGLFIAGCNGSMITSSWRLVYDNEIAATEEYNGEIYIATKQGLISLDRKRLFHSSAASLYLESVSVGNRKIHSSNIRLLHWENDLYFNFDILEYEKKEHSFSYELQGPYSDKGIIYGTKLHLQNLQPGSYMLSVYLTDANNVRKNILYIPLRIRPAFWQTKFFIIEMVIIIIALCVLLTAYFYRRQRKKQEHKAMVTRLIIEQRLTALKAQINPHFISNSLSAIQQLMLANEINKVTSYVAKFSLLIRYTLNYSDKSAACLSNEIDIIDLNIELEKLRFSDKFIFEKQIAENVNIHELYIPPLITQPLIENAIWHGLLPLKNHRTPTLVLKIAIESGRLIISIIDNGIGRTKSSTGNGAKRESKGIWLVENRIKNLTRLNPQHPSELRFTDLTNDKGEPAGTRVDLIFPLIILDELYEESNESHNY